ncbi:MAG: shikimate kinase [Firmicutes bacterium]|nr:shikimate kinase [Bacillota bacterium]
MDAKKTNIVLIGMPGSGKSTVGRILSKRTGMSQVDTDVLIERSENMKLQDIINSRGLERFAEIEEAVLMGLDLENYIVSTGGSAVYYPRAMEELKKSSTIVYLKTPISKLLSNIRNMDTRGISVKPGQTFEDLYNERCPLYEKYADVIVDTEGLAPPSIAARVQAALKP